jgi:hypothetical protein
MCSLVSTWDQVEINFPVGNTKKKVYKSKSLGGNGLKEPKKSHKSDIKLI